MEHRKKIIQTRSGEDSWAGGGGSAGEGRSSLPKPPQAQEQQGFLLQRRGGRTSWDRDAWAPRHLLKKAWKAELGVWQGRGGSRLCQ